jgi:hypothetical protein
LFHFKYELELAAQVISFGDKTLRPSSSGRIPCLRAQSWSVPVLPNAFLIQQDLNTPVLQSSTDANGTEEEEEDGDVRDEATTIVSYTEVHHC